MEALHITSNQDLAKLAPKDLISLIKADQELKEVERKAQQAPRGIVAHPAVFGRELAWSAGRVDFWFNLIGDLSKGHDKWRARNAGAVAGREYSGGGDLAVLRTGFRRQTREPPPRAIHRRSGEHHRSSVPGVNGARGHDGLDRVHNRLCWHTRLL
jgi:hypothetical protein